MKATLATLLAVLGAACSEAAPPPPPAAPPPAPSQQPASNLGAFIGQDVMWGDRHSRGNAAALAAMYTEDAVLIPPGEPIVRGRKAIEEYWSGALQSGGVREVSVETMDALSSGSLGYETGSFTLTVNGPNGEAVVDNPSRFRPSISTMSRAAACSNPFARSPNMPFAEPNGT